MTLSPPPCAERSRTILRLNDEPYEPLSTKRTMSRMRKNLNNPEKVSGHNECESLVYESSSHLVIVIGYRLSY
jgi:hypothetical protein